ncbi:MAG: hypothetical protein BWY43_00327 [candidate division WS2 bacterium ADurb.Bin280]|uniref:Uncharacterized protein n=1 Tax=candidate division WS2 bacterium ADurb.Bin280 TaxID=1852829 RepID=A0A1V5SE49_9BACT|nr:MAG: hypothetical protein BWY43_00327 [candidate division WS2 bacterium ADurb.Bin280]
MDPQEIVWHMTILLPGHLETERVEEIAREVESSVSRLVVRVSTTHRTSNGGKPGIRITGEDRAQVNSAIPKAYLRIISFLDEVHREFEVVTHIGMERC